MIRRPRAVRGAAATFVLVTAVPIVPGAATESWFAPLDLTGAMVARAAFEAPRIDPSALGRGGGQPAWPSGAGPDLEGLSVIGGSSARGCAVATGRWEGISGLTTDAAAAWGTRGPLRLALALAQRRAGLYAETEFSLGVVRPALEAGRWGWAFELRYGRWQVDAETPPKVDPGGDDPGGGSFPSPGGESTTPGRGGPGLGLAVGGRLSSGLSVAARWREWGGALAADAPGRAEVGVAARLGGWTFGAAAETGSPGRSLRTLVSAEADLARRLRLRCGIRPATGETSVGLGVEVASLAVDLARRHHPRLGGHVAVGLSLRVGGER